MPTVIFFLLDLSIIFMALLSALLWWKASGRRIRRVSRREVIDAADLNRIVIAQNRTQILNSRAALATAGATVVAAVRFSLGL